MWVAAPARPLSPRKPYPPPNRQVGDQEWTVPAEYQQPFRPCIRRKLDHTTIGNESLDVIHIGVAGVDVRKQEQKCPKKEERFRHNREVRSVRRAVSQRIRAKLKRPRKVQRDKRQQGPVTQTERQNRVRRNK